MDNPLQAARNRILRPDPAPSSTSAATTSSSVPTNNATSSSTSPDDSTSSLQERMLSIIERQQSQMQEMQSKLDDMGMIMAHMEDHLRYLRGGQGPAWHQQQDQGQQQQFQHNDLVNPWWQFQMQQWRQMQGQGVDPGASVRGYRIMGGFFGGRDQPHMAGPQMQLGGANNGPAPPPQQPQQQQGRMLPNNNEQQTPAATQQANNVLPPVPQPPRRPDPAALPQAEPAAEQQPLFQQGIFFPLFVMLFRFLFSLPNRLRTLLLGTGAGRIYVHLRNRAVERRAFANIDLGSIMKLLIMLLIFAGRAGRNNNNNNNRNRRNNNGGQQEVVEEFGMMAYAQQLLSAFIEFWNGHRVHTLVLASFIAFLIQVGLMSFLYDVLWVERGELLDAWLGRGEAGDGGNDGDDGEAEGGDGGEGNDNVAPRRANAANDANPVAAARGGGEGPNVQPADPPAAVAGAAAHPHHGGMIRRGPNNGGFFHDVYCLIFSFLLSLIPAWRPEEAAQEPESQEEEAEGQQPESDQAGQPDRPAGGEGDDGAADGDNAEQ
jgi:hypothetical protein